jgi:transketolase
MRTTFIETLLQEAERDERIWLLTADLGYSVLEPFAARFPDRYVNVGVAEQNLIGVAAGLAHSGLRPFVYSIANFPTLRCFEQIRNDVCYHNANVTIVAVGGGLAYGSQGYTHHGVEDLAVMRALPGMTVVAPGDPVETRLATRALCRAEGPKYMRLGKAKEPLVHQREPEFALGRAIYLRPGRDLTIISTGAMLADAINASNELAREKIRAGVMSMPTLKPFDVETVVRAARRTGAVLTAEEHSLTGGLGSATAEALFEAGVPVRFRKLGIPDKPYHLIGSQTYLKQRLIGDLVQAGRELTAPRTSPTGPTIGKRRRSSVWK